MEVKTRSRAKKEEDTQMVAHASSLASKEEQQQRGSEKSKRKTVADEIKLLIGVAGIYFFYLFYGIVQERVTQTEYGEEKERFKFTLFLVFIQCIVNGGFARVFAIIFADRLQQSGGGGKQQQRREPVPLSRYAFVSFTYVAAMLSSNAALNFVDYPTQVLTKSCKPIPVMIMGVLVYSRHYGWRKWFSVFMISAGITLFMMDKPKSTEVVSATAEASTDYWIGLIYLVASLALDSLTGPAQDHLKTLYNPSFIDVMYYSNIWAIGYIFAGMLVTGEIIPAIQFCMRHNTVILEIVAFSVCSALGQFFIYFTLHSFGSLALSVLTTTRKFFTILASVVWFGHSLSGQKWMGIALVFGGLAFDTLGKYLQTATVGEKKELSLEDEQLTKKNKKRNEEDRKEKKEDEEGAATVTKRKEVVAGREKATTSG
ncbi:Solute carrier family 35 member B1 [Balamuthia mandrillaris]